MSTTKKYLLPGLRINESNQIVMPFKVGNQRFTEYYDEMGRFIMSTYELEEEHEPLSPELRDSVLDVLWRIQQ